MQFTKTTHKCITISYTEEHGWYIKFLLVFYGRFQFILPPLMSTVPSPVLHTHYLPDLPPKLGHLFAFNAKINTLMIMINICLLVIESTEISGIQQTSSPSVAS